MTSRDFCFWLQGMLEISKAGDKNVSFTEKQVDMIQSHLNLVFYHEIDPSYTKDEKKQEEMNKIHTDKPNPPKWPDYGKYAGGNLMRC